MDAYAPQKQMGVCLFDSAEHVSLAADKHVLRYEPTQTKNEASSGYNMQFDYARASAPQDGALQYAQLRQQSMSVEAGEQQQVQLQLSRPMLLRRSVGRAAIRRSPRSMQTEWSADWQKAIA